MNACRLRSDHRVCNYFRDEGETSDYYDAANYGGGVTADGVLRARCDYWAGGSFVKCCGADRLCCDCASGTVLPTERSWEMRNGETGVCEKGKLTHPETTCYEWEPITEAQAIEKANEEGMLF